MIPYMMLNAVTQSIKGNTIHNASATTQTIKEVNAKAIASLAIDRVMFPFFRAISNFMELGAEWTYYGVAKSAIYAGRGLMYNKKLNRAEVMENKIYATNLLIKGILGTALTYALMNMLSGGGDDDDDDDNIIINSPNYNNADYAKQIMKQKIHPPRTLQYDGVTIPLDMFGSLGMGMYMQQAIRNAAADAWDKAFSQYGIKKQNKKGQSDYAARIDMFNSEEYKQLPEESRTQLKANLYKIMLKAMALEGTAMTFDLYESYNRRLGGFVSSDMNKITNVLARPIASFIPANAVQKEIAQMVDSDEKE